MGLRYVRCCLASGPCVRVSTRAAGQRTTSAVLLGGLDWWRGPGGNERLPCRPSLQLRRAGVLPRQRPRLHRKLWEWREHPLGQVGRAAGGAVLAVVRGPATEGHRQRLSGQRVHVGGKHPSAVPEPQAKPVPKPRAKPRTAPASSRADNMVAARHWNRGNRTKGADRAAFTREIPPPSRRAVDRLQSVERFFSESLNAFADSR
jgi:hypothetical protein